MPSYSRSWLSGLAALTITMIEDGYAICLQCARQQPWYLSLSNSFRLILFHNKLVSTGKKTLLEQSTCFKHSSPFPVFSHRVCTLGLQLCILFYKIPLNHACLHRFHLYESVLSGYVDNLTPLCSFLSQMWTAEASCRIPVALTADLGASVQQKRVRQALVRLSQELHR